MKISLNQRRSRRKNREQLINDYDNNKNNKFKARDENPRPIKKRETIMKLD